MLLCGLKFESWNNIITVIILLLSAKMSLSLKFESLRPVRSYESSSDQTEAVEMLIKRFVGDRSNEFIVDIDISSGNIEDYVHLQSYDNKIKITGSSGVAVAFGFNHYLKYFCRKHISWAGDQLGDLPNPLPLVPNPGVTIKAGVMYRYYQNVCTVSYSSVWWNWTRWEREIDWMALNGINLPLAFTGQEAIWERVYKKLHFTEKDLDGHFAGPAFLAWGRMGNIHGWGGPLPASWKQDQLNLQHLILKRMRSLGMIPVLPGFAGHVPSAITSLYPKAQTSQLGGWGHFNCTYSCTVLLEPDDPLFNKIGGMFIEEQIQEYNGSNHIYNADTFNEMIPKSSNTSYLANAGRAVYEAMTVNDPDAIWLMQGWLFHSAPSFWKLPQIEALVTSVPQGRLLILDLFSESFPQFERTHFYFGQPFIWCMLHNFGGNLGFYGKLDIINNNPAATLSMDNSTMMGTGITPEGINQNYLVYEFMLEHGFTVEPGNVSAWLTEFVRRRYNTDNQDAIDTWLTLGGSIYNDTSPGFPSKSLIRGSLVKRPSLSTTELPYWYNRSSLILAWDSFAKALEDLDNIPTVRYDAVDVTRQMLQAIHRSMYNNMAEAYHNHSLDVVDQIGLLMLDLLDDFDRILSTDPHFMMGCWIRDARALGATSQEKDLLEYNARNQVSLWGPTGNILDYADKHWASLTQHYYRPRWALFIFHLKLAIAKGIRFDHDAFISDVFANVEKPFTLDRSVYPTIPTENSLSLAKELYMKWRSYLK